MSKYVTVHGHFYQPPRENPWLEAIEPQDSAAPYHDWNARVSAECYEPNTASRILDEEDRIVSITNNYSRMSFNFGPTLLSWLEGSEPTVYEAILAADRKSRERFSGHGSALAQAYNHIILPLATPDEKDLQVVWGIRDFETRFSRAPEGMWLPETAVDVPSLEALALHGIRFTILAPSQAARVRRLGTSEWQDVSSSRIDPSRPYIQNLPSGREIVLFFYDGPLARGVAFEGLLHKGELFAERLVSAIADDGPRLSHIATDGESYGHHHPHGDMALAYALHAIESRAQATLTNYGEFLERFPPEYEVEIFENTSWSCAHGIERWRNHCGCHTGGLAGWTQSWRQPLRAALDWLRDRVQPSFDHEAEQYFVSAREALYAYVDLIRERRASTVTRFFEEHGQGRLTEKSRVRALKLLELKRQLQLMYTSCGWFFNDLAGLETVQVLQFAGRAVQLAEGLTGESIEEDFLARLAEARSNRPEAGSGRDIYMTRVKPEKVTWEMLGAHYAICSLFEPSPDRTTFYCYEVEREEFETRENHDKALVLGRARVTSRITQASQTLSFTVVHLGDHTIVAGVRRGSHDCHDLVKMFDRGDEEEILRAFERHFGRETFDLRSLFGNEKRRIVDRLLRASLEDAETAHRHLFERHRPTMRFLAELEVPPPPALCVAAQVVLNGNLRRALDEEHLDPDRVGSSLRDAVSEGVALDEAALAFTARQSLEARAERFFNAPRDVEALHELSQHVAVVQSLPFEVDLWKVQNLYFRYLTMSLPKRRTTKKWREAFESLGEQLSIHLPTT